jgi:hypothetical protein
MRSNSAGLVKLYNFPTGRRLHSLLEVARRAMALAATPIVEHANRAIAHDNQVREMEATFEAANRNRHGSDAKSLDQQVDHAVTGIETHLVAQLRVYGESSERGKSVARVRRELLPGGAGAITKLPFVRQHQRVGALLAKANKPDSPLQAAVQSIPELPAMLAQLAVLNEQYGASLQDYDRDRPTREQIAEARAIGRDLFAEVMAVIVAHYAGQPDRLAERDSLLEPILRQNEDIGVAHRRRRTVRDIDPGTGNEVPAPVGDLPGAGGDLPGTGVDDSLVPPA